MTKRHSVDDRSFGRPAVTAPTQASPLVTMWRVINALLLREFRTRFGSEHFGLLWLFLEPLALIVAFTVVFTLLGREGISGVPVIPFLIVGILVFFFILKTANKAQSGLQSTRQLAAIPHVLPLDGAIARALIEAATWTTMGAVALGLATYVGLAEPPAHALRALGLLGLCFVFAFGFGLALGALVGFAPSMAHVTPVIWRPLFLTSGKFYTLEELPEVAHPFVLWNPILHINEWMRQAYFDIALHPSISPLYAVGATVFFLFAGLAGERLIRGRDE